MNIKTTEILIMRDFQPKVVQNEFGRRGGNVLTLREPASLQGLPPHLYYPGPPPAVTHLLEPQIPSRKTFLELAHLLPSFRPKENIEAIPMGEILQIGILTVSAVSADTLVARRFFPWQRHADILLIGGVLTDLPTLKELSNHSLPWAIFFEQPKGYSLENHSQGRWNRHFVGLASSEEVYVRLRCTQEEIGLEICGARREKRGPEPLNKSGRIHDFLSFTDWKDNLIQVVTTAVEKEIGDRTTADVRARYAVNQIGLHFSQYLSFLEQNPELRLPERREKLSKIWDRIARDAPSTWQIRSACYEKDQIVLKEVPPEELIRDWARAFALSLKAWCQEPVPSHGPYR